MVISENTINDWVVAHTDSLYEWAFYKLSDEELTKDIVQETFITAFQKIDSFEGKSNPKTWLFSILNNKIIDHYRKEFRNPVESGLNYEHKFFDDDGMWRAEKRPKEWDCDTNLLDSPEFVKVLNGCMGKLPSQWASAIQLKYLSEKDGSEVCKELNITTSNYWQLIHRAKLSLRQCLELNWFK
jgi:RNA polymerase sigma-70 factor (TIGR02943 family)